MRKQETFATATDTSTIAAAYDHALEEENRRLSVFSGNYHEFETVRQALDRHIVPQSAVLDCGCGPGRYSEYLLTKKCHVGMADISGRSLDFCRSHIIKKHRESILFFHQGCATGLDFLDEESLDAILLMGPMYHLRAGDEGRRVLINCRKIMKKEARLFVMFMNLQSGSKKNPTFVNFGGHCIPQYRADLPSAAGLLRGTGFHLLEIIPVFHNAAAHLAAGTLKDAEFDQDIPNTHAEQFLLIAKK